MGMDILTLLLSDKREIAGAVLGKERRNGKRAAYEGGRKVGKNDERGRRARGFPGSFHKRSSAIGF